MDTVFRELGAFFASFSDPVFLRSTLLDFLRVILDHFLNLYPYVILGAFLGEGLKYTSWTRLVFRFTKRFRVLAILSATVLGILSPLCTYGTVPVLIALYGGGVSLAPLISFLAASSMMNPQLFVMTVGGLGWELALLRLLLVFVFALLMGFLTLPLPEKFVVRKKLMEEERSQGAEAIEGRGRKKFVFVEYLKNSGKSLWFVTRMMAIGILIAALVEMLPLSLMFKEVDTNSPLGILVAAVAGIPLYACGGGTIPMVASLLANGLSRGSALAFLTVGPATRITSLSAICTIFRKRFLALYVLVLLVFSVLAGMLFI